jgi:uncharacterized protein (UPF0332 family)
VNSVTWRQLLASHEVNRHRTSKKELESLRAVIVRDLADASLDRLSADRRFATAYNAALQAVKMAIACAGYRVAGAGHHRISFEAVKRAVGKAADPYSDYFDRCRRKRNVIDYDDAFVATETEAQEIVVKTREFVEMIEQWIAKLYPSLKA